MVVGRDPTQYGGIWTTDFGDFGGGPHATVFWRGLGTPPPRVVATGRLARGVS